MKKSGDSTELKRILCVILCQKLKIYIQSMPYFVNINTQKWVRNKEKIWIDK